jgi:hypothetical protein
MNTKHVISLLVVEIFLFSIISAVEISPLYSSSGIGYNESMFRCKGISIGPNFFFTAVEGRGLGLELGFPIAAKPRNLTMIVRYCHRAFIPTDSAGIWQYPAFERTSLGLRYFPGIRPYRDFFIGETVNFTHCSFRAKDTDIRGYFTQAGIIIEAGIREILFKHIYVQFSFGFGMTFYYSEMVRDNYLKLKPPDQGVPIDADATLIIGFCF